MVAPVARALRRESQFRGERVQDLDRCKKPLGVLEHAQKLRALGLRHDAGQCAPLALERMDARRLLGAFVDGQCEAAVLQLLVQVDRRRCQHDHDRPFDAVFLRLHPARLRVLARRGDHQLALRLQKLQGVARFLGPGFLHDGEDLVLEVRFAQIVEALTRHRGILDALLLREEREDGVHQGGLPGRARRLHNDRQGPLQLARHTCQIRNQGVILLADDSGMADGRA